MALVAALPAAGKEGVEATLLTRVPLDAPAGTRLEIAWTLGYRDHGGRRPFGASGVFVRLRSAAGGPAETASTAGTGEYRAAVRIPEGGIGDVEIGLRGWTNGPTGTHESDELFPITNDPLPGAPRSNAGWHSWIVVLIAAPLGVLAVLAIRQLRPVRKARLRAQPVSKPQSR